MTKISLICLLALLFIFPMVGCGGSESTPVNLQNQSPSLTIAENFVKNSPTYKFDGIPETFKLSDTVPMGNRTQYVFEFDCRHPGYGDRTGQVLTQVIEHHVAMIIIENEQVISGIIDARWDMIHQKDLNPRGT